MQFLSFSRSKYPNFFLPFFLVLQLNCLSECPNSKKTPYPSQIPGYTLILNGLSKGYSSKKLIHKFFGAALNEHATCINFQFHKLQFSQKVFLDFHVNTVTVDLCLKEVIDDDDSPDGERARTK